MRKLVIFIFLICFSLTTAQENEDSGILRIQVDVDNVKLNINEESIISDSYGNPLLKDRAFILLLSPGVYNVDLTSNNYNPIDTTVIIANDEVFPLNIRFAGPVPTDEAASEKIRLNLFSQPDNIYLLINDFPDSMTTPTSISIFPGTLSYTAFREGYEALVGKYKIPSGENISLEFLLKENHPEMLTNFDLELEYKEILPERNEAEAEVLKLKYNSLAETFAIFPLSQGILARLILDKNSHDEADILIISGAVLTAGSLILGKILRKKRIKAVRNYNERIKTDNLLAKDYNTGIDRLVREKNAEIIKQWKQENDHKGIVRQVNQ